MRCIALAVNGQPVCVAGIGNASMIGPSIGGAVSDEYPPMLDIRGMCELDAGRTAHVYWCENMFLKPGDCVQFAFVESPEPSPPAQVKPTDSPEYIEEQRKFEELERSFVPDGTPMRRIWPNLTFECSVNREPVAIARFSGNEEHILCSVLWDKWQPERCRVYVRSFGDKVQPMDNGTTDWFRTNLILGDIFEVRLAA